MTKFKLSFMMLLQYMMYAVWWVPLAIRYFSFYTGGVFSQFWMYYIGILIHGLIFGFFYVGGQIYINKAVPKELRSQARGFIFPVTSGLDYSLETSCVINSSITTKQLKVTIGMPFGELPHWHR